jgi:hypothetical protein
MLLRGLDDGDVEARIEVLEVVVASFMVRKSPSFLG